MRMSLLAAFAVTALPLAACTMDGSGAKSGGMAAAPAPGATAALADASGASVGTARLMQAGADLHVLLDATGLPAGEHGVHLHTTGKCEAPGFTTAGGHWNPTNMKHGMKAPMGPHEGDLPNMTVGADGTGHLDATIRGATLTALMDADGAAIVVHAGPDDYMTDPAGNSGGRIACGVVTGA